MKIGVLGAHGRLGSYLVKLGAEPVDVDVTNREALGDASLNRFGTLINCAAVTAVDACQNRETNVQTPTYLKAVQVNCRALEALRSVYRHRLIHLSSDYVFKGNHGPYDEKAKRDPVNDYGFTKMGGEVVLETHPHMGETVVVRTTGLYGCGKDFAIFAQERWSQNQVVQVANDLRGNHTYIPHLSKALLQLARMELAEEFSYLHLAASDICSRFEFAVWLAEALGFSCALVEGVPAKGIPNWVAPRPTFGGLKIAKARHWGLPLYTTRQGIQEYCG